jgi:hypothetical protein
MPAEAIVIWNGVNDGRDGDLLDDTLRVGSKIHPPAEHVELVSAARRVIEALPWREVDGLTYHELAKVARVSTHGLNNALVTLRTRGIVASAAVPGMISNRLKPVRRYWRVK